MSLRRIALLVFGAGLLAALATGARAEEALNLALSRTHLKTESASLELVGFAFRDLFSPTMVSCPVGFDCTLRVELSAVYHCEFTIFLRFLVDGSLGSSNANESIAGSPDPNPRAFTWVETGLAPGTHTVEVDALILTFGGEVEGSIGVRTLTIDVYKEPAAIFLAPAPGGGRPPAR